MKIKKEDIGYFFNPISESSLTRLVKKHENGNGYAIITASRYDWIYHLNNNEIAEYLAKSRKMARPLTDDDYAKIDHLRNECDASVENREKLIKDFISKHPFNQVASRLNARKNAELLQEIAKKGFSTIRTWGGWKPEDGDSIDVEAGYIVLPYNRSGEERDFEDLKEFVIDAGSRYKQYSVIIKPPVGYEGEENPSAREIDTSGEIGDELNRFDGDIVHRFKNDPKNDEYFTSIGRRNPRKNDNREQFSFTFKDESEEQSEIGESLKLFISAPPAGINGVRYRRQMNLI